MIIGIIKPVIFFHHTKAELLRSPLFANIWKRDKNVAITISSRTNPISNKNKTMRIGINISLFKYMVTFPSHVASYSWCPATSESPNNLLSVNKRGPRSARNISLEHTLTYCAYIHTQMQDRRNRAFCQYVSLLH